MIKVNSEKYKAALLKAATMKGIRDEVAEQIVDCMVFTDMLGIMTHGSVNLGKYIKKMEAGGIDAAKDPSVISDGPTYARLDGENNFGMYNGRYAMDLAMKKADEFGMGMVTVHSSGHCGAIANYTVYAAEKGYLAFGMSNAVKLMCVPGGKGNIIGNSPISYAIPNGDKHPIFMDIALSEVAKLKVVTYQKEGKEVPNGWCVDLDGKPTTHPEGNNYSLLPAAYHKGYCMAFFVEVLTTVLSGGSFDVKSWAFGAPESHSELAHTMIAIRIDKMMEMKDFYERLGFYVNDITGAPKADGSDKIFYPGEPNWIQYDKALQEGLTLPDNVEESVRELFDSCGIALDDLKF